MDLTDENFPSDFLESFNNIDSDFQPSPSHSVNTPIDVPGTPQTGDSSNTAKRPRIQPKGKRGPKPENNWLFTAKLFETWPQGEGLRAMKCTKYGEQWDNIIVKDGTKNFLRHYENNHPSIPRSKKEADALQAIQSQSTNNQPGRGMLESYFLQVEGKKGA